MKVYKLNERFIRVIFFIMRLKNKIKKYQLSEPISKLSFRCCLVA